MFRMLQFFGVVNHNDSVTHHKSKQTYNSKNASHAEIKAHDKHGDPRTESAEGKGRKQQCRCFHFSKVPYQNEVDDGKRQHKRQHDSRKLNFADFGFATYLNIHIFTLDNFFYVVQMFPSQIAWTFAIVEFSRNRHRRDSVATAAFTIMESRSHICNLS